MNRPDVPALAQQQSQRSGISENGQQTETKPKSDSRRNRQSRQSSSKSTLDNAVNKPNAGASKTGRSGRNRAKTAQPTINVVPRILARPQEPISRNNTSESPQLPAAAALKSTVKREAETPPQTIRKSLPIDSSGATADSGTLALNYLMQQEQSRNTKMVLLTASGKLLDSNLRRHLGSVQCRSCIGVLGRLGAGKSTIMSYLAGTQELVFPAAKHPGSQMTSGIDFWVTPSSLLLLDTPPVLSIGAADKWTRRSENMSKLSCARLRDLQLTSFLLQICDTLLVVVNPDAVAASAVAVSIGKKAQQQQQGKRNKVSGGCIDQAMIKLLKMAQSAVPLIPGLSLNTRGHEKRPCSLHIVVNNGPAGISKQQVSEIYANLTGISVSKVTVLPAISSCEDKKGLTFVDISDKWSSCNPLLVPLYSTGLFAKHISSNDRTSLISSADIFGNNFSFDECIEELKSVVLDGHAQGERGWRKDESKGAWLALCLKTWDSIRRSDVLVKSAATRDEDLDRMDN
ncbi:smg-9, nonsense mediated mRNA decay factor [Coemansia asiatica]|uniref:Smg-9, nonsense mediated mRNA decay factor n=1 Tax=Coemansia asiatica TaxID=1052880 RepID=A0A9W8CI48_9FUNG|nr:smg-9, nonsense mediated mRNA decay factor [Coemansia asiatica]